MSHFLRWLFYAKNPLDEKRVILTKNLIKEVTNFFIQRYIKKVIKKSCTYKIKVYICFIII